MSRVARLMWIGSLALGASWPSTSRADTSRGSHSTLSPWRKLTLAPSVAATLASLTAFLARPELSSARLSTRWTFYPLREPAMRASSPPLEPPRWATPHAPLLAVPVLVTPSLTSVKTWDGNVPLTLDFHASTERGDAEEPRRFGMTRVDYVVPPLLRYSSDEANVSVSITPGGPCTAACLKVAGSF